MKLIKLSHIEWDVTDGCGDDDEFGNENLLNSLPGEVTYKVTDILDSDENPDDFDEDTLEEMAVDHLSDEYGFCIFGCDIEIVDAEEE